MKFTDDVSIDGIIGGGSNYSTQFRNSLDYIGENLLGVDYDRPCIDNPNVTSRDNINKANEDDAREYNNLRNNSVYKVLAIYGAKQITCAGVDFFRANKAYIKANASQVLNDGKVFMRALEKTSGKGVTLSSNGAGQFNNIKNTVKEYKALKNIESASKKNYK